LTKYHVYSNNLLGGPVDYSTPVATVAGLAYSPAALPHGSDATFAVRAFDDVTGLEERNTDRRVRIVTDAAGVDVSARPNAPAGLHARPSGSGGASVTWTYSPLGQRGAPTGFRVWVQAGGTINYAAAPTATVPYAAGVRAYSLAVTGLSGGTSYAVAARATNAAGDEPNAAVVAVVGKTAGPTAVDPGAATFSESP